MAPPPTAHIHFEVFLRKGRIYVFVDGEQVEIKNFVPNDYAAMLSKLAELVGQYERSNADGDGPLTIGIPDIKPPGSISLP